jgi:hypothetical protein
MHILRCPPSLNTLSSKKSRLSLQPDARVAKGSVECRPDRLAIGTREKQNCIVHQFLTNEAAVPSKSDHSAQ